MVFKGLLVVVSGFLFIFASGVPMRLISRFNPDFKREGIFWGMGIWIIAFLISNFILSFTRMVILGTVERNPTTSPWQFLIGTIFTTLLIQVGMFLFLKDRLKNNENIISNGLALGFGIGVIAQVLTGMILITSGANVLFHGFGLKIPFGALQAEMIEKITDESIFNLIPSLISFILYRIAILTICATQGYLVAKSIIGKKQLFWAALFGFTAFIWINLFLQKILGEQNLNQISLGLTTPLTSWASAVYYLAAFILGYQWLSKELHSVDKNTEKARSKK
jgi:hypothetical protein